MVGKLKKWNRVFVNRSINMGYIQAIGFDMDHTLAVYNRNNFETLAFRETLKKFIAAGYPEELSQLQFQPSFAMRGLMVDRERGNLLKVDAHKYVKNAYHGRRKLDKETRHNLYNRETIKMDKFLSLDSFFALSEIQLFVELVEYRDKNPKKIQKSYGELYDDLRKFIDRSHADGSIKSIALAKPEDYFDRDKNLPETLIRLLEVGKKIFLLTNSSWDYTSVVLSFILDDANAEFKSWRDYFDYVIVGARKPDFFTGTHPFYEVVTSAHNLLKIHSGKLEHKAVYYGGSATSFQQLTGHQGDQILYVGDHLYSDIIRSKGLFNWRTMLIVEELESEIPLHEKLEPLSVKIYDKLKQLEIIDEEGQLLSSRIAYNERNADIALKRGDIRRSQQVLKDNQKISAKLGSTQKIRVTLEIELKRLIEEREFSAHPVWGELMKAGLEQSRFAAQLEDYACVYSSRVSNLRFYSPFKRFTAPPELLPHEL